ncbi:G-type lectin S-receptor-like serine/threonine-protein kinase [Gossypium australe]|uniref:G-type lectin S-receptor-like serine/threonine-protein kinase n=1 Tax=Gossypium australe TaxID=47621 RepID=A0A5B6X5D8_9ROSI|nr:G-type lectin S-receptor-like serine/threonine-protein kinase [Gossypium australe]
MMFSTFLRRKLSGNTFVLGFFSPANSRYRYVGIWHYQVSIQTVVWVANRENPINETSGTLSISSPGNLVLYHKNYTIPLWSTNSTLTHSNNSTARLLDTGNLVLVQNDITYWQSFDYPTNTMLPFMKIGLNLTTGVDRFLTPWKSPNDPGIGNFTYKLDSTGFPQLFLHKGLAKFWRAGSWTGQRWVGIPEMRRSPIFNYSFVYNDEEIFASGDIKDASIITRMIANETGEMQRFLWNHQDRRWVTIWSAPKEDCDFYGHCGPNSNCDQTQVDKLECSCLPGFEPKSPETWSLRDWSAGCARRANASICKHGEGFVKVAAVKIPDTAVANADMGAFSESNGGTGCLTWHGDLLDINTYRDADQDLFIRVDALVLASYRKNGGVSKKQLVAIFVISIAVILSMVAFAFCLVRRVRRGRQRGPSRSSTTNPTHLEDSLNGTSAALPVFNLGTIAVATNNFSPDNRLGQGGFGPVYKGTLNGKERAVERLSKSSGQGIEEFKNEVTLIAKLQHRNLLGTGSTEAAKVMRQVVVKAPDPSIQ